MGCEICEVAVNGYGRHEAAKILELYRMILWENKHSEIKS